MRSRTYTPASTLLFLALLLLPLGPAQLFAQQAPDQGQYAPNQPLPDQRSDYGQSQPEGQLSPQYPPQSYPDPGAMNPQPGNSPIEPLRAQELQQLVAPIALYPDTLVAQVLTAATYPAQVADADRWRRMQGYASSDQIAAGADAQPWDPSPSTGGSA